MEISQNLICPCNNKLYKNQQSLKQHHKTQTHLFWENSKCNRETLININRLENENGHLRRLNIILMERINDLEKKI